MGSVRSRLESLLNEMAEEDHLIAWVEKKTYGDTAAIKRDIERFSKEVGFDITRFELDKEPYEENGHNREVIRVYTDSFSKIPVNKANMVKDWLMKEIYWTQHVCNAEARIEGKEFNSIEESPQ